MAGKNVAELSRSYLEQALEIARADLPGWAFKAIHNQARSKSGGLTKIATGQPSVFEKIALLEIRPALVRELPDAEVENAWRRLHQWFANSKKAKKPVEDIVNAGLWTLAEMKRRGFETSKTKLVEEINALKGVKKQRRDNVRGKPGDLPTQLREKLAGVPDEILICRDFAVLGGSGAVTEKPNDMDVIVRADYDKEKDRFLLDGTMLGVALRRQLAPNKRKDRFSLLHSPQGSFTDYVPLFDLVARKRAPHVEKIEDTPPGYKGQQRVIKSAEVPANVRGLTVAQTLDKFATEPASKEEAGYKEPAREKVCGTCRFYLRDAKAERGKCQVVEGGIAWFGSSELYVSAEEEAAASLSRAPEEMGKQVARAASKELLAQAARAKKTDTVTPGQFFLQPKPTRPAEPEEAQTVDSLVALFEERAEKWLPTFVQKKFDGARHQIHKVGGKVTVLSEDGDNNTDRLPGLVKAIQKLKPKTLVLDAELERWSPEGKHLPREAVAGYLASKDKADDRAAGVVANVFDILYEGSEDVHARPLRDRLDRLAKSGIIQATETKPDAKEALNLVPSKEIKTPAALRKETERVRKLPGSEGIVAKGVDSSYPLDVVTPDTWVKFHNATPAYGIVISRKATKGGASVYTYGILPGTADTIDTIKVGSKDVLEVGDSFATDLPFKPGDKILIEGETVNHIATPKGVRVTVWVPRVLGVHSKPIDTVDTLIEQAKANLVLSPKREDEAGVTAFLETVAKQRGKVEIPTVGKRGAKVAFVGASGGKVEAARKEPFVGPGGETLNDVYLKPLNLTRSDIVLTNAVPRHLTDEEGKTRLPVVEEIKEWNEWLTGELDRLKPKVIIALGRDAEGALGDRSDLVLPHPSAVRRFGDSGEVKRKLKRVRRLLQQKREELQKALVAVMKQPPKPLLRGEGETRSKAAFDHWDKNWHEGPPKSGEGRFVYHHHWRGLTEEQSKQSEKELLGQDGLSLHGDLRLEGDDSLWGFAMLLGRVQDNRQREHGDKLIGWETDDNIELAPKLLQPKEWLDVGRAKVSKVDSEDSTQEIAKHVGTTPLVTGPGEAGATAEKFSKFFALDWGTYKIGNVRKHGVELFLDGTHLKGRYLFQFAPVAGKRRWLIDKPEDQTPISEKRDLADLLGEIKGKGQKFLIWTPPGEKPQKIDVTTRKVEKSILVPISKADPDRRIVSGVVLDPYIVDSERDWTPPRIIKETSHRFVKGSRVIGLRHAKKAEGAAMVESHMVPYPSQADYDLAMKGRAHRAYRMPYGRDVVHSGAWILDTELTPKLWKQHERGELNAYSIGGFGFRTPVSREVMPDVTFIDLTEFIRAA